MMENKEAEKKRERNNYWITKGDFEKSAIP